MTWQDGATELIREVEPTFTDAVYVVSFDDVAMFDPYLAGANCRGWTQLFLDAKLKPYLESVGKWQGAGFATIMHPNRIPNHLDRLGIALHEFAHHITRNNSLSDGSYPVDLIAECLAELPNDDSMLIDRELVYPDDAPPWHKHEKQFVRACSHLAYRAGELLAALRPKHLSFGARHYGTCFNENTWVTSLSDELGDARPIRETLTTEPPEQFSHVYELATSWWYEQQKETDHVA